MDAQKMTMNRVVGSPRTAFDAQQLFALSCTSTLYPTQFHGLGDSSMVPLSATDCTTLQPPAIPHFLRVLQAVYNWVDLVQRLSSQYTLTVTAFSWVSSRPSCRLCRLSGVVH